MGGVNVPRHLRWQLIDAKGIVYVGPEYIRALSEPSDVQLLVNQWWEMKKAAGHAGVNAEEMRKRLEQL